MSGRRHLMPKNPPPGPRSVARLRWVGLGFHFKWNMGWMHDVLDYMTHDPMHRRYHHNQLTFGLLYAFTEKLCSASIARRGQFGKGR